MKKTVLQYLLYDGMNTEGQLFRIKKDDVVHFILDVSLIGCDVRFFINYPDSGVPFKRSEYRELHFNNPTPSGKHLDCFDNYFELKKISVCGSFHFYFSKDGSAPYPPLSKTCSKEGIAGSGYIMVDPDFTGTQVVKGTSENSCGKKWDLSGVVLQSYLSKNLGIFPEWESRLQTAMDGCYNMIHFTPLQELGYSRSAYSLRDQLTVNPSFTPPGAKKKVDWTDIECFVRHLENNWAVLSMTDLVFNHTSNDSPWIHEHPESAYNVVNSPHLAPAYLLDHIVWRLTIEASTGSLTNHGIPSVLSNPNSELPAMEVWLTQNIEAVKLHEFFIADVDIVSQEFTSWLTKQSTFSLSVSSNDTNLSLKIDGPRKGKRFGATVDFLIACHEILGKNENELPISQGEAEAAAEKLRMKLKFLNHDKINEIKHHLQAAVGNVLANARYRFYDPYGLRLSKVTLDTPIMWAYFYHPVPDVETIEEAEAILSTKEAEKIMAFNGWVMNDDPLKNFAEPSSFVYLRRELIVWGDSVKLRMISELAVFVKKIGEFVPSRSVVQCLYCLHDCYVKNIKSAKQIGTQNIRFFILDVRCPMVNIYHHKNTFSNFIQSQSLSAKDCHDLGRQVHRYGAIRPAGAFFERAGSHRLYPSISHAVFYDQTHDNPSVLEKHSVFNYLPLSAIGSFACCAIGSTRGYDELVPHYIDVVKEERFYSQWPTQINYNTGIVKPKSILNELHQWLSSEGFSETFVDQVTPNILAVTRFCPETREAVLLITHTAFHDPGPNPHHTDFHPIRLGGRVNRLLCELLSTFKGDYPPQKDFKMNPQYINGLMCMSYSILQNVPATESKTFHVESYQDEHGVNVDNLIFHNFPPGSVVIVSIKLDDSQQQAIADLHNFMSQQFDCRLYEPRTSQAMGKGENAYIPLSLPSGGESLKPNSIRVILGNLNLIELNKLLFRCSPEEIADGCNFNSYQIPNWGWLVYCGFQSIANLLQEIRDLNDLGHPICSHLRQGDWLAHYLTERLTKLPCNSDKLITEALIQMSDILKIMYKPLSNIPRYLVPAYFEALTVTLTEFIKREITLRFSSWIRTSSSIAKNLAVATTQFYGFIGNSRIPGRIQFNKEITQNLQIEAMYCSLSAGLPHFAEGMWRSWGRDTFIALRGCLLLTGRYQDAANIILSYASLLRHGLIPNLIGDGFTVKPRYNCRDAVWYWLYSIITYEQFISSAKECGLEGDDSCSILNCPVYRWFPNDDTIGWPDEYLINEKGSSQRIQPLHEIMQEALQRHITGIDFIERNAGPNLDEQMKPEGFKVQANVDLSTGFPRGGNAFNCGTWMDKMGSSAKAGNQGIPATPRDGSAVELVGLAYAVVSWLEHSHNQGQNNSNNYPHSGVQLASGKQFSWKEWSNLLKNSFESHFWIPDNTEDPNLLYNKGIYRDSVGSSGGYTDNQLRPNFLVTMVVASELFTPERAWNALEIVQKRLTGPIGMCTLSRDDLAYRGYYDNSNDSYDYSIARGFNYHQGPEWIWPTGYYLRARLKFARMLSQLDSKKWGYLTLAVDTECQKTFARLSQKLESNQWFSLPELTNSNGQVCKDSCEAQAWSVGCILEALYELIFNQNK
ncbi:hypothetical protein MN116_001003 [Schistosoma mekongi]|uniref:4-alpha-glucanotransferase n=1 Tax=Schistosoma mekongi TaxID=38744 RepID=A0AAE1ZKC0_SCHME|nr:hypothetical protein MN116_001003 [Schistosoma mekongi]